MAALVNIIAWTFSVMPRRLADATGRGLGLLLFLLLPAKRRFARGSLAASFPDWPADRVDRTVRGMFRTQGRFIAEVLRLFGKARPDPLDMITCEPALLENMSELYRRGKGVLVLTAHINNYEMLLTWAARRFPMTVITKRIRPPSLDDYFRERRESSGIRVLPARGSYRDIIKALRSGGCVGFVMDQNMKHDEGVFVTFFDRPACTTPGLAMLSAHSGAPVQPVFVLRDGAGYQLRAGEVIEPPPDRKPETLHQYTQRYTNVIEDMIRTQPESWIWMHRRWKTPPRKGDPVTRSDGTVYHA